MQVKLANPIELLRGGNVGEKEPKSKWPVSYTHLKDVRMLLSYDDDESGSYMTTNYICIPGGLTVKQAMSQLVRQAGENDNIMTIYVVDSDECFAGAIDLKDLITAREAVSYTHLIMDM